MKQMVVGGAVVMALAASETLTYAKEKGVSGSWTLSAEGYVLKLVLVRSGTNSVLLRPLPVADPGRVLALNRGTSATFSYPDFQDLQERGRLLSGLTASFPMESDLEVDRVSEFVAAEVVSANYGAVLGVLPARGRWFTSETEPVAVVSHAVWQNRFGGSANVLGRRIGSEEQSYTIGGVERRALGVRFTCSLT